MRVKNILSAVLYTVWTGKGDSQLKNKTQAKSARKRSGAFRLCFYETLIKYVITCETQPPQEGGQRWRYGSTPGRAPCGQFFSDLPHFLWFPVRWFISA